jgi:hypothetical protein
MTFEELPKNAANAVVAAAPAVSYLSDASAIVTILAGLVSTIWVVSLVWKMYFPDHFEKCRRYLNRKD